MTDNGGTTATSSVTITVNGDGDGDGFFAPADCNDGDNTIFPGAPDAAGDNIDQNCDGIDGEQANAIFVNGATGANTSTCGTILEPCGSIGQGQSRAVAEAKTNVFVGGGTYAKFTVAAGLEVRGGYGQNWQRGVLATGATVANVNASFDASVGGPVGIIADNISTATRVADLKVNGATAGSGQNSYGVVVRNSTNALVLDSLDVDRRNRWHRAQRCRRHRPVGPAQRTRAATAAPGSNQAAATRPTPAHVAAAARVPSNGGSGGKGGAVDASCNFLGGCGFGSGCNAQEGENGFNGSGAGFGLGGLRGSAGTSGLPGICNLQGDVGQFGSPGTNGSNGSPGGAGAAAQRVLPALRAVWARTAPAVAAAVVAAALTVASTTPAQVAVAAVPVVPVQQPVAPVALRARSRSPSVCRTPHRS